ALLLLLALYTAAIFAPMIASDRPWFVRVGSGGRFPVLESLSAAEIGAMAAWIVALLAPLWLRKPAALLVAPAIAGVLFAVLAADSGARAASEWKRRIAAGEVDVSSPVFAPIGMGFAETNLAESFRPPTWLGSSEMTEEGTYVRGPRVPTKDPVT